ncbi:MAG TPA: hypothetical protein VOA41_04880 [Candidatus Dormibacteraeota bacterium]|nr:hypothetical protein [Candidatus Dormibacteraeota bacterium]
MRKIYLVLIVANVISLTPVAMAQEKAKSEQTEKREGTRKDITPVRVQVVFNEFEGEKKVSSLPYTILINADDHSGGPAVLRMGLRVPIQTGGADNSKQFQYIDIGTNMDGRAEKDDEGRFLLHLSVDRSSAYSPSAGQKPNIGGTEITSLQPVIQQFKSQMNLRIRDGQTIQSTVSTDPITGRVIKVDVTLNILK